MVKNVGVLHAGSNLGVGRCWKMEILGHTTTFMTVGTSKIAPLQCSNGFGIGPPIAKISLGMGGRWNSYSCVGVYLSAIESSVGSSSRVMEAILGSKHSSQDKLLFLGYDA